MSNASGLTTELVNEALAAATRNHGSCEGECHLAIILREVARLQNALTASEKDAARFRWLLNDESGTVTGRVSMAWRAWDGGDGVIGFVAAIDRLMMGEKK